ncbi:MAG: transporter, partial [Candidatus Rokubacteria bacterium]|nr:transporter [Candidatus Rokubacteria bacterium]
IVAATLVVLGCAAADAQEPPKPDAKSEADEPSLSVAVSPEYTRGKFGTGHTTQILYIPLKTEWAATDTLEFSLTVPYLWERGRNLRALVVGRPLTTQATGRPSRQDGRVKTEEGLGDVLLEVDYTLLEDTGFLPDVTAFVEIKFPTADSSRGLGTGAFDEAIGTYLTKKLAERWTAHLDLSYVFVGSPHGLSLDNIFTWSAGVSYGVTSALKLSGYIDGATTLTRDDSPPVALRAVVEYTLSRHLLLTGSATAGLTHQAPDFGVLTEIKVRF